ncbi:MAG: prolyl oligopeptidase family serine peptidase [Bacteroidales bacterium]|nr:prolyl oligopeptidase family serine peptidase [Bacteroidales bacterium]
MKFFTPFIIMFLLSLSGFSQRQFVIKTQNYIPQFDTVNYYLPSASDSLKKFPAVILLHGYDGSFRQWGKICNLQKLSDEFKMILICPDGFKESWYINSPVRPGLRYADFFFEDFLPEVFKTLPVDTAAVFLTGLSMGGHGALHLFSLHPEKFRAAGSISGVVDLRSSSVTNSLTKVLGIKSKTNENWDNFSAMNNIEKFKAANKPLIINCGSQDFLIGVNRKFAQKCSAEGIKIFYMESPGKHNKEYWNLLLPEQLRFFRQFVSKQ